MNNKEILGHFITLEGGEGAGKSTLLTYLETYLVQQGLHVIATREPGGTRLGEAIRDLVLQHKHVMSIGNEAELLLFLAARAEHIQEKILPALQAGKIVLCDRFNDSTIAYQGGARGLGIQHVRRLCHLICGPVVPQLTLYLDVSPELGLARTRQLEKEEAGSGALDRIESETLSFHQNIRKVFLSLAKKEPHRLCTIDANQSLEEVQQEAVQALKKLILI